MSSLRERKKRETRERISNVATELFFARGFDAVTVGQAAAAAGVSKMRVFNYFARSEGGSAKKANAVFIALIDRGFAAIRGAMGDRP